MRDLETEVLRSIRSSGKTDGLQAIQSVWNQDEKDAAQVAALTAGLQVLPAPTQVAQESTGAAHTNVLAEPESSNPNSQVTESISRLTAGLEQLRLASLSQIDGLTQNTQAVSQNTVAQGAKSGSSTAGAIGKILSPILMMTGIAPIISGIRSLFGGSDSTEPVSLTPYTAPAPIHYEGVIMPATRQSSAVQAPGSDGSAGNQQGSNLSAGASIQINVQAMDSRSFMDHSDQIASAVRDALLRAHPLNDVVNEA